MKKVDERSREQSLECEREEALHVMGPWCGEQRLGLTVVLRKPNFVNKQECIRDILFHL